MGISLVILGAMAALIYLALNSAPRGVRGRPLISCYTVVLALFGAYFLLPAMMLVVAERGQYIWATSYGGYRDIEFTATVSLVALAVFVAVYQMVSRRQQMKPTVTIPSDSKPVLNNAAWLMLLAGFSLKLALLWLSGGFEGSVSRLSSGINEALGVEREDAALVALKNISGIAEIAILWLILHALYRGRSIKLLGLIFISILCLSYVGSGKRLYLLLPLVIFFLGIHFYRTPLKSTMAIPAFSVVLIFGFLTLMFRIYAPASLANVNIDLDQVYWAQGSLIRFYFLSLEFASFEFLSMSLISPEKVTSLFGGAVQAFIKTNIEPLTYLIPRFLWDDKPEVYVDLSHANRVAVFGGSLEYGGGIASTLLGTSWIIAGPIGMFFAMTVLGIISALVDNSKSIRGIPSPAQLIAYSFTVVLLFHLFRQGTLAWTAIIMIVQQIGIIGGFLILVLIDRGSGPSSNKLVRRLQTLGQWQLRRD